jgi:hypothetical protein
MTLHRRRRSFDCEVIIPPLPTNNLGDRSLLTEGSAVRDSHSPTVLTALQQDRPILGAFDISMHPNRSIHTRNIKEHFIWLFGRDFQ